MDAPSDLVFYTTFEVAELLHLSVSRVRQLIRTGRLKARVHRGRCNVKRLCVLQSDLRDFLHGDFLEQYWAGWIKREGLLALVLLRGGTRRRTPAVGVQESELVW